MKNMTLDVIAKAVGGVLYNGEKVANKTAKGVVIDSRQVEEDYIFIAIKGERVDGHTFIGQVLDKGALAVVCEDKPEGLDKPYILVKSSADALRAMAKYYREQLDVKVVGITGSVGKTSTKEFISAVLSERYDVLKTEGNFNNEIGLPLTVLKIRDNHQIAVIEMGISHFGDMEPLGIIAQPDVCVITNIGCCHLEHLIDRDGVLKEKSSMFNYANEGASYVLNGDDDKLATITDVNGSEPIFVSLEDTSKPVCVENITETGIEGTKCTVNVMGNNVELDIPLPGKHMVSNALVACAVGSLFDVSLLQMAQGINKLQPVGGRVNIIKGERYTIIDDCYNANPVSMKASIDVLKYAATRKVAVLGDMFELGAKENELHGDMGAYIAESNVDVLITVGRLSKNMDAKAKECGYEGEIVHFDTLDECLENIEKSLVKGDTVLVKASHGMHLEKIVEILK